MSLAFIDPILDLSRQKLHMLVWMREIKIFVDTKLNSPAQIDTKIMSEAVIDPILAPNPS